ncbi:hypothetical protein C8034_v010376 [Colletotrichum sidae]|uniref:Uncharacterized protein n=1 Tax=Colletotrichum sidae TaxID=1347389 RepID=A0A4R8TK57_9PEZI|nr:hypothetical protein C8034_v010376 [Colletotrichum sidae]
MSSGIAQSPIFKSATLHMATSKIVKEATTKLSPEMECKIAFLEILADHSHSNKASEEAKNKAVEKAKKKILDKVKKKAHERIETEDLEKAPKKAFEEDSEEKRT